MAVSKQQLLPLDTGIEVIAIKGNRIVKTEMTFAEALQIKKVSGWKYINYQLGKSQFNL